jgi:hypothetical protein
VRWGARVVQWRFKMTIGHVISEVESPVSSIVVYTSNAPPGYRLRSDSVTVGTMQTV